MRYAIIQRLVGLFLLLFSLVMAAPLVISLMYRDGEFVHFTESFMLIAVTGLLFWLPVRKATGNLRVREAFLVVTLFWVSLGVLSGLPFMLGTHTDLVDSVFESVSAFTTTGATVIVGLDNLPPSILFYRQLLQWLGGMGVVVLAVAVLPMLGVGGMQLYRAETPGPIKDDKLMPRIQHTARALWLLYCVLTVACALAYWLAGMSLFDAVAHSFATVSSGGFSTHDASLGFFDSPVIESVAVIFMLAGAINFSVHLVAFMRSQPGAYWRNTETRVFLLTVAALTLIIAVMLFYEGTHDSVASSLRYSLFQVVSVITSTGFTTADFSSWPLFLPVLLMFSSFMGGCSGSTAGGMKVIRVVVLFKQALVQPVRLLHPAIARSVKIDRGPIPEQVQQAIWGFFSTYVAVFVVFMLLVISTGETQVTAFSSVAACLNNLGPGLGAVTSNFTAVSDPAKVVLTAAMIMGRLEIFTLLVLLTPTYWRN